MRDWAFESLLARLPDDGHLVLELGAPSSLSFPKETGRVVVVPAGHKSEIVSSSKIAYVEGDVTHVPTVLNAASFALDLFDSRAIILMSVGGLDELSPADAHELCEFLIWDPGPCVAALVKARHKLSWRFSQDPTALGLVARIQDYKSQDPSPWWLYVRPQDDQD